MRGKLEFVGEYEGTRRELFEKSSLLTLPQKLSEKKNSPAVNLGGRKVVSLAIFLYPNDIKPLAGSLPASVSIEVEILGDDNILPRATTKNLALYKTATVPPKQNGYCLSNTFRARHRQAAPRAERAEFQRQSLWFVFFRHFFAE